MENSNRRASADVPENVTREMSTIDEASRSSSDASDDNSGTETESNRYHKVGLVNNLHGDIYQLKIQMLFLKRALDKGYASFELSTEDAKAEEFNDIVFIVREEGNADKILFLQAKHSQDQSKTITLSNLLSKRDQDFSLAMYFKSYRRIIKGYSSDECENFIVFTNARFKLPKSEEELIYKTKFLNFNDILTLESGKLPTFYKLSVNTDHELYKMLERTSDLHVLAEELKDHVLENKTVSRRSNISKLGQIFDIRFTLNEPRRYAIVFRDEFVRDLDLTTGLKKFRDVFREALGYEDTTEFRTNLKKIRLPVSVQFAELCLKTPRDELPELTCEEIEDTEIKNFLDKLVFAVEQPDEVELGEIIAKELGDHSKFNLLSPGLVADSFQREMLDWFKEKGKEKGKEGTVLNAAKGEKLFDRIEQKVSSLISVGLTLSYREEIQAYGTTFEDNNVVDDIRRFLSSEDSSKKVLHVVAQEETLLSAINVYGALEKLKQYAKRDTYIFMRLSTFLRPETQKCVMNAFKSDAVSHNLIIIDCESGVSQDTRTLYETILKILVRPKKKVIVIAKEHDPLAVRFTEKFEHIVTKDNIGFCDLTKESNEKLLNKAITFQGEKIRLNKVIDGSDKNVKQMIGAETLVRLITDQEIKIGCRPPGTCDLEGAHSKLFVEVNMKTIVDELLLEESSDIYIISGIPGSSKEDTFIGYLNSGMEQSQIDIIKDRTEILYPSNVTRTIARRIQITCGQFNERDFKQICRSNPESKIYWIDVKDQGGLCKFTLAQIYDPGFYVQGKRFSGTKIAIDKNVKEHLASSELSEMFIFWGIDRKKIASWLQFNDQSQCKQFNENCNLNKIVFSPSFLEDLLRDRKYQSVHLLHFEHDQDQLFWFSSYGSLQNLCKYRAKDYRKAESLLGEDDLIKEIKNEESVIIAGDPGMGKSTVLTKLYESKSMIRTHWIIRVNLNDHLQAIRDIEFSKDDLEAEIKIMDLLSQVDESLKDDLARSLLRMALREDNFSKPLLIVFDGFDKILDKADRDEIVSLLQHLKYKTNAKFWITTRLHYEETLENKLSQFARKLESMDEESTREFIVKYLSNRLRLILSKELFANIFGENGQRSEMINLFIDEFLRKMQDLFKDDMSKFIGTPLQIYLMLEHSERYCVTRDGLNNDFSYLGNNIWEVYENFIERRYDTYFRKAGVKERSRRKQGQAFVDSYCRDLAISLSLRLPVTKSFEELKDVLLSPGILRCHGDDIEFSYPTFKEYFAAGEIINWIDKWKRGSRWRQLILDFWKHYLLMELLLKPDYRVIREFLNAKLSKEKMENVQLQEVYYNQNILFVAVEENNVGIASFALDNISTADVNTCDCSGKSILQRAAQLGNLEMVKFLVNKGAYVNAKTNNEISALHFATEFGDWKIVKFLVENGANVNARTNNGYSVLHFAVENGHLKIVRLLIKNGARVNARTNDGRSVTDFAAAFGHTAILTFLIKSMCKTIKDAVVHISVRTPSQTKKVPLLLHEGKTENRASGSTIDIVQTMENSNRRASADVPENVTREMSTIDEASRSSSDASDDNSGTETESNRYHKVGLVNNLHGDIYQLKIQMLFLKRALDKGYASFELSTEDAKAEKFNDIVFIVREEGNADKILFLQAKHSQDQSKTITLSNLLSKRDQDFSLAVYFKSYRRIIKEYSPDECENFIVFTNARFELPKSEEELIYKTKFLNFNDILALESGKSPTFYKLGVNTDHELYKMLERTSDLHVLAEELKDHVLENKTVSRRSNISKLGQIFDIELILNEPRRYAIVFRDEFLRDLDLTTGLKKFRDVFREALGFEDAAEFRTNLKEIKLPVSVPFVELCLETPRDELPELTCEEIEDTEIKKFLDKLVFAVEQPDEVELGEIIAKELGDHSKFNLLSPGLVADSFQREMLDWFKEKGKEKGKEGTVLNAAKGEKLFDRIEQKVSSLISVGLTLSYREEIQAYGTTFEDNNVVDDIRRFLSSEDSSKKVLHVVAQEETLLSAINVYGALGKLKQYSKRDSYIFMRLSTFLRPETQKCVMNAFKSEAVSHNLIIIDCESGVSRDTRTLYETILKILLRPKKKVIVIAKEHDPLAVRFTEKFEHIVTKDNIGFCDLTKESNEKLLNKEITFQGEKIRLNKVIDGSDKNVKQMIGAETLVRLITDQEIKIGCRPPGTCDLEGAHSKLFVEVNMKTIVDELLLEESSDIYIISGIPGSSKEDTFIGYLNSGMEQSQIDIIKDRTEILYPSNVTRTIARRIQITCGQFNERDFKQICRSNPESKIYWIDVKDQGGLCKFTLAQIYDPGFYVQGKRFSGTKIAIDKNVKEHLASSELSEMLIFWGIDRKKIASWLQFNDQLQCRQFNENCNLNKIVFSPSFLEDLLRDRKYQSVQLLYFEHDQDQLFWFRSYGSLQNLWKYRAKDYRKAESLLGEDDLIKAIKNEETVIIAGDPGMGKSTVLTKLYESKSMIRTHWIIRVNLNDHLQAIRDTEFSKDDLEAEIKIMDLLSQVDESLKDDLARSLLRMALREDNFSKPLLIVFDGFDKILDKADRDEIVSLLQHLKDETYAKFWITTDLHYEETLENKLSQFARKLESMDEESTREFIVKYLSNRLRLILSKELFANIFGEKGQGSKMINVYIDGFLRKMQDLFKDDMSKFIGTPLQIYLMLEHSERYCVTRDGLNNDFSYLGNNIWEVYENFIQRRYDTYFRKAGVKERSRRKQGQAFVDSYCRDLAISLSLRLPATKSFEEFKDVLLSPGILRSHGDDIEFSHPTFKEYFAAREIMNWIDKWKKGSRGRQMILDFWKDYLLMELLLKPDYRVIREFLNAKLSKEKMENVQLQEVYYNQYILFVAAEENNVGIASFALDNISTADVNTCDGSGKSILQRAAQFGNLEMVKFLVNKGADVNAKTNNEISALHFAIEVGDWKIVKFLVENGANVNARTNNGYSVLHFAVENGHLKIVRFLIKNRARVNARTNDGRSVTDFAAAYDHTAIVAFLKQNGAR
ncbi:uncharacterized protein LOC117226539 [Megalopta genalis]|uniref:uncharacterized protein LOC117226539 n=1 Tax=Megalopta genalis TaxID=115081 RepID=UPI003FD1C77E